MDVRNLNWKSDIKTGQKQIKITKQNQQNYTL